MPTRHIIFYSADFCIYALSFKVSILEMCSIYHLSWFLFNMNIILSIHVYINFIFETVSNLPDNLAGLGSYVAQTGLKPFTSFLPVNPGCSD